MELDGLMLATGSTLETWSTAPTNWRLVVEVMANWCLVIEVTSSEKSAITYMQIDKLSANLNLLNCGKYTEYILQMQYQTTLIWLELDGLTLATGLMLETWSMGPTNWWLVIEVMSMCNWPRSEKSAIIYTQIDKLSAKLVALKSQKMM